jgi:hypothetical protein
VTTVRRLALRLGLTAAVVPALVGLPVVAAPAAEPAPVPPRVQTLDVAGVARAGVSSQDDRSARSDAPEVLSAQVETRPFALVGVTWPSGQQVQQVQVRVREDGTWSAWETLQQVDEGPDAGTPEFEASAARTGTTPLTTDGADGVQVRVDTPTGTVPRGVQVSLVDPGTSAADRTAAGQAEPAGSADAALTQPRIVTRAQWGADESLATLGSANTTVKALVLHHTAGSNTYSQAQAVAQLRGVYAYHTQSLGWSDIGYNLVVDRYGTIYEGRRGSITSAPRGAHAGGFNRDTYGVSVMGDFVGATAPPAVTTALNSVIGWKLGQYGTNPRGTSTLVSAGGGTARWPEGTAVTVNNVLGHKDVGQTSCPGSLYSLLPSLRTAAATLAARTTPNLVDAFPKDVNSDRLTDLLVVNPSGRLNLYTGNGDGTVDAAVQLGRGWGSKDLAANVGDWNRDGRPDVLARDPGSGGLYLYPGTGATLGNGTMIGSSWRGIDLMLGVGDMDRDGDRDLVGRRASDQTLWLYRGDGVGGFQAGVTQLSTSMAAFDQITAVGDLDDGGDPDLVVRAAGTGLLYRMGGNGVGGFGNAVQIGHGWGGFDLVVGVGDMDRSQGPDLLARTPGGQLHLFHGTREGGFSHSTPVGRGWAGTRFIA